MTNQEAVNTLTPLRSILVNQIAAIDVALDVLTNGFVSDLTAIKMAQDAKTKAEASLDTEQAANQIFRDKLVELGTDPNLLVTPMD